MPPPLVAIVGRPNVGKSTLFNRIVGRREAIVSDVPGTTRDRVIAVTSWDDFTFTLVDTGGLEPFPQDVMRDQVREQVQMAVDEADCIVFLVDTAEGVTLMDEEIAQWLRRTSKPVVLAANKVDNPRRELLVPDFYTLGMGDPVIMSAYHNLGLEDLMLSVHEMLPHAGLEEDGQEGPMRLAIIGRTNVGKSALMNAILGQQRAIVSNVPGTTRDALDTHMEYDGDPVVLIDTAGIRRPGSVKQGIERYSVLRSVQAVQRCDIALLVMDATELATSQDAHVTGLAWDAYKGIIVVVNKSDLLSDEATAREIAVQQVRRTLHFAPYLPICFTSALEETGIDDLMRTARATYEERTQRVTPPELVRAMRQALAKNPHPSRKGKSILLEAVRQVDTNPPTFVFAVDNPSLVHFSYQRYLENHLRQWFGFTHTHLRLVFKRRT